MLSYFESFGREIILLGDTNCDIFLLGDTNCDTLGSNSSTLRQQGKLFLQKL